jgi:succinate dehydrogenase / fumarate reductase cytochrome b subunit
MAMASWKAYLGSSIGKKKLVGLTGLAISLFTLTHMAGNLLMFVSADAYNLYSHALVSNPAIYLAEAGLVAFFLIHVLLTVKLTMDNRAARPAGYQHAAHGGKKTSFAAKTAILTGLLLLAFVVLHLQTFKFGPVYMTTVDGVEMRDIYTLVIEKFREPGYVAWYLLSLVLLGMHLSHGFKASFQSLGLFASNHPTIAKLGWAFAIIVAGGFITQPLAVYFFGLGG